MKPASGARHAPDTANALLPRLVTARLDLRAFVPGDLDDIVRLDGDAHVMRYIADGRALARATVERNFARVLRYPSLNAMLGAWRASRRDTGAFVGWFSLKYAGTSTDIEIGYRLLPAAWGRGYATEGAAAMRDHGFGPVGLDAHHRHHAPGERRVAARARQDRDARRGLGPLLRPRPAALRDRGARAWLNRSA